MMVYPGKIFSRGTQEPHAIWKDSVLVTNSYAGPVQQVKSQDMEKWENTDPRSMPLGSDDKHLYSRGPEKYSQIGLDGYKSIVGNLFNKATLSSRQAVMLVD